MTTHRAFADDGPLAGNASPMVDRDDENRGWPAVQMSPSGSGADQRHLYRFLTVSVGTEGGVPVCRFLRTLDPDEPDPELGLRIR